MNTLEHFEVCKDQLPLFVSDGAVTMLSVGVHIHPLHLVAETFRHVGAKIASAEVVFLKSPKLVCDFHRLCADISQPPLPILTSWGTWLQAA